jgi:hypothetical protein
LAKKQKQAPSARAARRPQFNIESSPLFTPVVFVLVFLGLVVLFSDFLFSDRMLHGSDTITAGVFFRSFLADHVAATGSVPKWNPYIFGGMPYIDAFHGDIFYPLSVLKFFGSIYRMLGINLFLHIFLAGLFMYFCARQFKLQKIPALVSAVAYMYTGYLVSLVAPGHDGKIFVTALFPLVILFLERGFRSRPLLNFSLLGLVIGVIILSPHPQMSYYMLWVVALYAAYRLVTVYLETRRIVLLVRPGLLTAYAVVIGLLISAIQFYPGYYYTTHFSPRAEHKSGWEWATSWSMHQEETMGLLIPEFAGTASKNTETYYWGKNHFRDNAETVGAVTFFLGLLGFLFVRRRESWFFGGLAIFALLYALGDTTPVFYIFYYLIPKVQSLRAPAMIMYIFAFCAALLAGMLIQRLIDEANDRREKFSERFNWLLLGVPALLLVLALAFTASGRGMIELWTSLFYSDAATRMVGQGVSKLDLAYRNLPAIISGAWLAFLFTSIAATAIWLYRQGKASAVVLMVIPLVMMIDGIRFNSRFVDTFDHHQYFRPNPISQFLQQQSGKWRTMNFTNYPADLLPFFGVEVVTGYHGNQLLWYEALLGGLGAPNQANPRFLNLVGARYLMFPGQQQLPQGYFGAEPVKSVQQAMGLQVMDNPNAFERLYLVDSVMILPERDSIISEVIDGITNLQRVVILEEVPRLSITPGTQLATDSVWFEHHGIDSIAVGVHAESNLMLVLTENYYDAWKVTIDGESVPLMRAYGSFRAVPVPAGTRQVVFRFESPRYQAGRLATILTLVYLLGVFAFFGWRHWSDRPRNRAKTQGVD